MNKQMRMIRPGAQGGFTLIELIVVIVILGILAATALPRFADLGADARVAALRAARGSLESTAAMTRGRFLAAGNSPTTITMDDATVGITNGYPTANAALATAAGLGNTNDWIFVAPSTGATANLPATTATQVAFVPNSLANNPRGLTCHVIYNQAAAATTPPVITVVATANGC